MHLRYFSYGNGRASQCMIIAHKGLCECVTCTLAPENNLHSGIIHLYYYYYTSIRVCDV